MTQPDPFGEYHRAEFRSRAGRVIAGALVGAAIVTGLGMLAGAAPAQGPLEASPATPAPAEASLVAQEPAQATTLPAPAEPIPAAPASPPTSPAASAPGSWSIAIDATGYQKEIDDCLWVRMDLGIDAPLVGAHNYCGGSVVLDMAIGDTVTLTGQGLDGQYRVSEERLARAGDIAADATAGLSAAVILQTCFWENDGSERLLALLPVQ